MKDEEKAVLSSNFLYNSSSYNERSCFGPIYMDLIDNNCSEVVELQMSGTIDRDFQTFNDELELLSAHFQVSFFVNCKNAKWFF